MFHYGFFRGLSRSRRTGEADGQDLPADERAEMLPLTGDVAEPVHDLAEEKGAGAPPLNKRRTIQALSDALSPSHPVADRSHLFGRELELEQLFRAIIDMRAHAFVYGARGAGKTSLARAFGDHADERGSVVIYLSCEGGSSFADIFRPYLDHLPPSCFAPEEAGRAARAIEALGPGFRPRALAGIFSLVTEQRVILIVDEFDRVANDDVRGDVATLLKLMTDMRVAVHLLLVGIARDAQKLVEGHESLRRHLVAIGLGKFGEASAAALLDDVEHRSGLRFDPAARQLVSSLAAGSPYHLRLFAFCAGIAAVELGKAQVCSRSVIRGLRAAFGNWAELNPADMRVVCRAAERGPAERRVLEKLALVALDAPCFTAERVAARLQPASPADRATAEAASAIALLAPALADADEGGYQFRDTLAPQFLLLACCFADGSDECNGAARQ